MEGFFFFSMKKKNNCFNFLVKRKVAAKCVILVENEVKVVVEVEEKREGRREQPWIEFELNSGWRWRPIAQPRGGVD